MPKSYDSMNCYILVSQNGQKVYGVVTSMQRAYQICYEFLRKQGKVVNIHKTKANDLSRTELM